MDEKKKEEEAEEEEEEEGEASDGGIASPEGGDDEISVNNGRRDASKRSSETVAERRRRWRHQRWTRCGCSAASPLRRYRGKRQRGSRIASESACRRTMTAALAVFHRCSLSCLPLGERRVRDQTKARSRPSAACSTLPLQAQPYKSKHCRCLLARFELHCARFKRLP
jgi:hypothetical protein